MTRCIEIAAHTRRITCDRLFDPRSLDRLLPGVSEHPRRVVSEARLVAWRSELGMNSRIFGCVYV